MLTTFSTLAGRRINIESVYCGRTYEGVFLGKPDEEMNRDIVAGLIKRAHRLWPGAPVAVVNEVGETALPPFCVAAMTITSQPVHAPDMHGSQLILIWFTDLLPFNAELPGTDLLQAFAWEDHATDFRW